MNQLPHWILTSGPPNVTKPTRLTFAVDPVTRELCYWNMAGWSNLASILTDVEVYVNSLTGDDDNPGSATLPLQTLAAALGRMPIAWRGQCRIKLAAGGYALPDIVAVGRPLDGGEPVCIEGEFEGSSLGTSTVIGVVPGARLQISRTPGMTLDAWAGWYLRVTSGTSTMTGARYLIASNTTDTFTLTNQAFATYPQPSDTFVIERPASVINYSNTPIINDQYIVFFGVRFASATSLEKLRISHSLCFLDTVWFDGGASIQVQNASVWGGNVRELFKGTAFTDLVPSDVGAEAGGWRVGSTTNQGFVVGTIGVMDVSSLVGRNAVSFTVTKSSFLGVGPCDFDVTTNNVVNCTVGGRGVIGASGFRSRCRTTGATLFRVNDINPSTMRLNFIDATSTTGTAIYVASGTCFIDAVQVSGSVNGMQVLYGGRLYHTGACSIGTTTNELIVGSFKGTWALNATNGITNMADGSLLSPQTGGVWYAPGTFTPPAQPTANYMGFVLRAGAAVSTMNCNLVRATSLLRVTPMSLPAGVSILSVVAGVGTITLTLSGVPVPLADVLIEVLKP